MSVITVVLKLLIAVVVFGLIVFVHEFGHFIMARLMGVRVNEFALGMGPRLLKFKGKETEYSLRLFPIGGFCSMAGEDAAGGGSVTETDPDVDPNDPRAFFNKKVWRRILIVVAGAAMNLLLGFVVLVTYFAVFTKPVAEGEPAMYASKIIAQLNEDAPAYQTGLRVGDDVLSINGKRVYTNFDLANILQTDEDGKFDFTVRRDGEKVALNGVTFDIEVDEETGTRYLKYDFKVLGVKKTAWTTVTQAARMETSVAVMIWRSFGDILTGKYGLNELSGPIGTVEAIGDAAVNESDQGISIDWESLLMMTVIITVNVGVLNLLPFPALDGGRLVFLVFEGIFRKKVPPKFEGMVHVIGFVLLLLLMVVVAFSDIWKLFS